MTGPVCRIISQSDGARAMATGVSPVGPSKGKDKKGKRGGKGKGKKHFGPGTKGSLSRHREILEHSLDIALFELKQAEDAQANANDDMGRIKPGKEVLACQVRVDFIDWKQNALDMSNVYILGDPDETYEYALTEAEKTLNEILVKQGDHDRRCNYHSSLGRDRRSTSIAAPLPYKPPPAEVRRRKSHQRK